MQIVSLMTSICKGEIRRSIRKYMCMWIKLDIKLRLYETFALKFHVDSS